MSILINAQHGKGWKINRWVDGWTEDGSVDLCWIALSLEMERGRSLPHCDGRNAERMI